jgi:hypothetical protein
MVKRSWSWAAPFAAIALALSLASCTGGASSEAPPKKIVYRCLSSSCDATVTRNEGDPVPEHCGKPMIH